MFIVLSSLAFQIADAGDYHRAERLTPFQREMRMVDNDRDGKLSVAERRAYLEAEVKRREDHLKKWDKDADGKLDDTERTDARAAARKALAESRRAAKEGQLSEKASTVSPQK